ncbi:hypothetical protein BRAS3843_1450003 [Bradyrhizobium sp. STM 3843]|nr:hypothetical protein BRAS3843_1450003 [Bradyrhizobium sp. STM 3843]
MALKVRVMRATVRKNLGNSVAHGLGHAQLALRAAGSGASFLMMARHFAKSNWQSPAETRVIEPMLVEFNDAGFCSTICRVQKLRRVQKTTNAPREAGQSQSGSNARKIWTYSERWIVSTR